MIIFWTDLQVWVSLVIHKYRALIGSAYLWILIDPACIWDFAFFSS